MRDKVKFEEEAARQIFQALAKGENKGYVGWFTNDILISKHPMDIAAVDRFLTKVTYEGPSRLYDAIVEACQQTLSRANSPASTRRIVFVITDGEDNQSHTARADAVKAAQRQGVPIFALGMLSSAPGSRGRGREALSKLTKETGGTSVLLDEPGKFLDELLKPLAAEYFVTIHSPALPKGGTHPLQLKCADHGVHVVAPTEYGTD